jgi:hypothetical protein
MFFFSLQASDLVALLLEERFLKNIPAKEIARHQEVIGPGAGKQAILGRAKIHS